MILRAMGQCPNVSMHARLSSSVSDYTIATLDTMLIFAFAVSRPLFVEEHGLRHLLDNEGVGVELSRQSYEAGDWAAAISEAWIKGDAAKRKKREDMAMGIGAGIRDGEGRKMAQGVVDWVNKWTASSDGNAEAVNAIVRN